MTTEPTGVITSIYLYPIKSCRGISVSEAMLTTQGLLYDREFLIVDSEDRFITQRTVPELALIKTEINPDFLKISGSNLPSLQVPWADTDSVQRTHRSVVIWKDTVIAEDMGDEIADWFSCCLNQKVRLVRRGKTFHRPIPTEKLPDHFSSHTGVPKVSFADGYPVLIITEQSLADLNQRLNDPLPMNRFRPNIVIDSHLGPYTEDTWDQLWIGENIFYGARLSVRCVITTTDQETLRRTPEPLKTLATYRRTEKGVTFGRNFLIGTIYSPIQIGNVVTTSNPSLGSTVPKSRI